jgi:DNA polymerase-3 subunit delta'
MEFLPWHEKQWSNLERAWQRNRLPHALLLEGPAGLGKSLFALRIATLILGVEDLDPEAGRSHPDLTLVTVPPDKKQISVNQIRDLCAGLSMTSHGAGYKVAIIDPAERMNIPAANSLLKTLEEPTPDTVLILVRSRLDTLPLTVASRCQKVRFATPPDEEALAWLESREPGKDWSALLRVSSGAPLAALRAASEADDELDERLAEDLREIAAGRRDPVKVAAEWARLDPSKTVAWLNGIVVGLIRERGSGHGESPKGLQNLNQVLPLGQLFRYLDEVQAALRRIDGALNLQMTLESLLIPWASQLRDI